MNLSDTFIVVDTETTGPNPDQDRVIQVGWATFTSMIWGARGHRLVNPGVHWDRGQLLIYGRDGVGIKVPQGAFEVHGIAAVDIKEAPPFGSVWLDMGLRPPFVTYNGLHFDVPMLEREAETDKIKIKFAPHVDAYPFVAWHFRHWRSRKLGDVCAKFNIRAAKDEALHAADIDCQMTGMLTCRLVKDGVIPDDIDEAVAMQTVLAEALEEESQKYLYWFYNDRVDGQLRMGCGKHVGKLIADVPKKEWQMYLDRAEDAPEHIRAMFKEFLA